jgi:hypothetical protein
MLGMVALLRLIHLGFMAARDPFFFHPAPGTDMETYWNQAKAIAGGDLLLYSFSGAFYYGPLYSYFLAPWIVLAGPHLGVIHGVQFLLGFAVPLMAWYLARRLAGDREASAAGLLAGLAVPALFWNQTVLVEGLNFTLISGALVLMVRATQREARQHSVCRTMLGLWLLAGALLGLAVSARGNTLLLIVGLAVLRTMIAVAATSPQSWEESGWKRFWLSRRQSALLAGVFFAGSLATLALPIARNVIVANKVAITTNGPAMLYIGNYRDAIGVLTSSPHLEELMKVHSGSPPYLEELAKDIALDPWRLVQMQWLKTRIFVSAYDAPDNFSLDLFARFSPVLQWNPVGWTVLVALGGVGLWSLRRKLGFSGELWPITAMLVLFPLTLIPILVVGRYRLPWLFPLMVAGGLGAGVLLEAIRQRNIRFLTVVGVWFVLVWVLTLPSGSPASWAITGPKVPARFIRPNDFLMLAQGMKDTGRSQEDIFRFLMAACRENPEASMLVYHTSSRLIEAGRAAEAVPIMERYMAMAPADMTGAKILAHGLIESGRADRAVFILDQLVNILPGDREVQDLLQGVRSRMPRAPYPTP